MNHIKCLVVALGVAIHAGYDTAAFSASPPISNTPNKNHKNTVVPKLRNSPAELSSPQPVGTILLLDHLNINHEKGRHDWLKAFYFDFLQCVVDPRKLENYEAGQKTVWANIGIHQFHLPEGKPTAQVLDGVITLCYPNLSVFQERLTQARNDLANSQFDAVYQSDPNDGFWNVTDPWGNQFHLNLGGDQDRDPRGQQPGARSEGMALHDLTFYTPANANMAGISRFYQYIFDAPILHQDDHHCVVSVGPYQTLTFCQHPHGGTEAVQHDDLRLDPDQVAPEGFPRFPSNYGPHISIYVNDFATCYQKAAELGVLYVNPRFKRQAYTLDQALDDCMFRILEIKDPDQARSTPTIAGNDASIIRLEHEVRSIVKRDETMYKSCPFYEIPEQCQ